MNRNILILFMSWLGVTGYGQATSPNETQAKGRLRRIKLALDSHRGGVDRQPLGD